MNILPDYIQKTYDDIKTFKIRSATTIAKAIFDVLDDYVRQYDITGKSSQDLINDFEEVATKLSLARDTEPMARNGVKYVLRKTRLRISDMSDVAAVKQELLAQTESYFALISDTKASVVSYGTELLKNVNTLYTHCNSTVAENIIKNIHSQNPKLKVIADETRPRMQGRITATALNESGIEVIFIPDTASSYVLIGEAGYTVDAVIIGADEITMQGEAINQIGSLNVALAAYTASIPVYVVTPALKVGVETLYKSAKIEERSDEEVWSDAPAGIEVLNPVFETVPKHLITGYITEFGLLNPDEIGNFIVQKYEWLM